MCLAGCQLIAQTQGFQLVCIWGSLVKFQGAGVVLNFDALPHLDAVCMQAMLLLIFQVNKQLTWRFLFWMVFLRPMTIQKNGVNWGNGFAIGDANTKTDP